MNPSDWARIYANLKGYWPAATLPPQTMALWYPLLADLDTAAVAAAARTLAAEPDRRFPPAVGEIRAAAMPRERNWADALAELEQACRKVGAYQPAPAFEDVVLVELVRRHGWARLCSTDMRDTTWRAQWRDEYTACARQHADVARRQLATRASASPVGAGLLPALGIGDPG